MELLKILRSLTDHHARAWVMTATTAFGLVRQRHVLVVLLRYSCIRVVRRRLHELVLRIQYVDVLQVLSGLLEQRGLTLGSTASEIGVLCNLALRLVPVLEVGLGPGDAVLGLMRRVQIHHLDLTLGMVDGALFVALACCHNFLAAVRPFLPLLQVSCVYDLLLVTLENLGRVGRVRAGRGAAKASLIVIVHLLL